MQQWVCLGVGREHVKAEQDYKYASIRQLKLLKLLGDLTSFHSPLKNADFREKRQINK